METRLLAPASGKRNTRVTLIRFVREAPGEAEATYVALGSNLAVFYTRLIKSERVIL